MARLEGFEPPTLGLEIRCSILLSYRRNMEHSLRLTKIFKLEAYCFFLNYECKKWCQREDLNFHAHPRGGRF